MASLANSSVHLLLLVVVLAAAADAVTFTIVNKCGYTVWPAALPSGDGNQLDPGQSWAVLGAVPRRATAAARLRCAAVGAPPVTVAEFSLGQASKDDYFDISLVDGFNAPMAIVPAAAGGRRCPRGGPRCAAEITLQCPGELRAKAGCSNPCRGNSTCGPTKDTEFFKKLCPETVTYARDGQGTTFTCPAGTDYQIVFCP
ncbi:hypothetical protein OsJ_11988 [Oryza sativa Japonica Group]|uniref:Uncharacterized protein n=1 Tax=Oryza sativa subsp. japonica TaxID=39947 RepID=A3AL33_ORYSJ|nr:hypothetical protein OsJ_11988 [Oryza sativa Japonica Group]